MRSFLGLLCLLVTTTPAMAQQPLCELHVWPSRANPAASPRDQAALIAVLTPSTQALAASTLDLLSLFGMGPGMVIFESDNLDLATAAKNPHRLLTETPACHAELLVLRIEYSAKDGLKTDFTFRDFRGPKPRIISGSAGKALRTFPARDPAQDSNARREISSAFAANLASFANQVTRHPGLGQTRQ